MPALSTAPERDALVAGGRCRGLASSLERGPLQPATCAHDADRRAPSQVKSLAWAAVGGFAADLTVASRKTRGSWLGDGSGGEPSVFSFVAVPKGWRAAPSGSWSKVVQAVSEPPGQGL